MAIKRVDPKATFKVVSRHDDALVSETKEELEALKAAGQDTRYEKFLESFDLSILKLKEGVQPTYFILRALKHEEMAQINERHFIFDASTRTVKAKNNADMLLEMFSIGCVGTEENGQPTKIDVDELPFEVAVELGGVVNVIGALGKNLKKA